MNNPNVTDNLKSYQKGESRAKQNGAKGGKNKAGSKHLKTLIQDIGNNIDWSKTTLKDKDKMKEMYGKNGWTALTYVAFTKAAAGDIKAMDWLAKNGYGQNIDVTSNGETLMNIAMVEFVDANKKDTHTDTK